MRRDDSRKSGNWRRRQAGTVPIWLLLVLGVLGGVLLYWLYDAARNPILGARLAARHAGI